MYKKICKKCNKPSYSSYSNGEWLCPYCKEDLSKEIAEVARVIVNETANKLENESANAPEECNDDVE